MKSPALQITWKVLNLCKISLLGECWPQAPAHPVQAGLSSCAVTYNPLEFPPPQIPLCFAMPPGKLAWQSGRAALPRPPASRFNYNQLFPSICPVLDSLHIVSEKLSGIAAFVYIKYRMIEDLATSLFSFLSHAFLPKHFPLSLPDHCLNCV